MNHTIIIHSLEEVRKKLAVEKNGKTLIERKVGKRWGEQKCRERVG